MHPGHQAHGRAKYQAHRYLREGARRWRWDTSSRNGCRHPANRLRKQVVTAGGARLGHFVPWRSTSRDLDAVRGAVGRSSVHRATNGRTERTSSNRTYPVMPWIFSAGPHILARRMRSKSNTRSQVCRSSSSRGAGRCPQQGFRCLVLRSHSRLSRQEADRCQRLRTQCQDSKSSSRTRLRGSSSSSRTPCSPRGRCPPCRRSGLGEYQNQTGDPPVYPRMRSRI